MFDKGSEWRKWDLQVHPAENSWWKSFDPNSNSVKNRIIAFLNEAVNKKLSVIAITDHNFGGSIDVALEIKEEKSLDIIILPGVELNTNEGWHIFIIFNPEWKEKNNYTSWQDAVRNFLSLCQVSNPFDQSENVPIGITAKELIQKVNNEDIGIVFFSHCLGDKGFFKEASNDSRKEIIKMSIEDGYLFGFDIKNEGREEVERRIKNVLSDNNFKIHLPVIRTSDAKDSSSVGSIFTWIKADPTFEGLKQILYEPEERVFLGKEPEILQRVRENKTKFIRELRINQVAGYNEDKGIWFKNIKIPFNPGLVAIIGNKGMGKSAITDILALCGNSHRYNDFSFLRQDRFLKEGLANNFEAELKWESGEEIKKGLNENTDANSPERVRYFPQNFFERLTNNLEAYEFKKELEKLVFSYLSEEEKYGKATFDDLIRFKKADLDKKIALYQAKLKEINEKIIDLEKKKHPEYRKKLEESRKLKIKELEEHEKIKPKEVPDPSKDESLGKELQEKSKELDALNEEKKNLERVKEELENQKSVILINISEIEYIKSELGNLKTQIESFINDNKDKLEKFNLKIEQVITYKIDFTPIKQVLEAKKKLKDEKEKELKNLLDKEKDLEKKIKDLTNQLSEPQKRYQKYMEDLEKWEKKRKEIEGKENLPHSVKWYENEIGYIEKNLDVDLSNLRNKRIEYTKEIFRHKNELLDIYKKFKKSVEEKIFEFQGILGDYQINIDASFRIDPNFYDDFLRFINQKVKGSFYGIEEGKLYLKDLVKNKNFNDFEEIVSFLNEIIDSLEKDKREKYQNEERYIKDQIIREEKWIEFYNFLFSLGYLEPVYELKLGNKNIELLSPGEKGALLIVFYLLLDKEDIPLIIDQPEENLDNESIYRILTHFIRYAKNRRQLIVVTHNPNLAIVGDAEQIIYVHIDKVNNNKFSFESGAIENSQINKHCSDILEGTLKAFDKRRLKYLRL